MPSLTSSRISRQRVRVMWMLVPTVIVFALYNTKDENDTLVAGIRRVSQMF